MNSIEQYLGNIEIQRILNNDEPDEVDTLTEADWADENCLL